MGMDVYGTKPKNEKGEYFRNNIWWWRPLADFIVENYPDIAENCKAWHSNDGDGLDESLSASLATRIKQDIAIGRVAEWGKTHDEWRASLPREACNLCECTGIRTDEVGVKNGMPERELDEETKVLVGRSHGFCNGCHGVGTRESSYSTYPFDEANVAEFAEFLENCGGFQIC